MFDSQSNIKENEKLTSPVELNSVVDSPSSLESTLKNTPINLTVIRQKIKDSQLSEQQKELLTCCYSPELTVANRIEKINALIKSKKTLAATTDEYGHTALHLAILGNDMRIIQCLAEKNIFSFNKATKYGASPLHLAVLMTELKTVKLLVEEKHVNYTSWEFEDMKLNLNPLELAILAGRADVVAYFLDRQPVQDITRIIPGIGNILHLAIRGNSSFSVIEKLVCHEKCKTLLNSADGNKCCDANGKEFQYAPFIYAAHLGNCPALNLLYSYRDRIQVKHYQMKQKGALHAAVGNKQEEAVNWLLNRGFRPVDVDDTGATALTYAKNLKQIVQDEESKVIYEIIDNMLENCENEHQSAKAAEFDLKKITNLIFQGGGPKGIAYLGAIKALEARLKEADRSFKDIKRVAGTSAGAIKALFLALGYNAAELEKILDSMDLKIFIENKSVSDIVTLLDKKKSLGEKIKSFSKMASKLPKDLVNLLKEEGVCSGEVFRQELVKLITAKLSKDKVCLPHSGFNIEHFTFGDLRKLISNPALCQQASYKHLYVVTLRIDPSPKVVIMDSESGLFDDVIIADAVRASMSIPFIFEPHLLHQRSFQGQRIQVSEERHVDGGVIANYMLELFDKVCYQDIFSYAANRPTINDETLGFRLYTPPTKDVPEKAKNKKASLLTEIAGIYLQAEQLRQDVNPGTTWRTIEVSNCNVSTVDFDITPGKIAELKKAGEDAVNKFLAKSKNKKISINNPYTTFQAKPDQESLVDEHPPIDEQCDDIVSEETQNFQ